MTMKIFRSVIAHIGIALAMIVLVSMLGAAVFGFRSLFDPLQSPEAQMGLVVVLAVSVLIVLLYLMVAGFSVINVATKEHALGLPEGSIRALIALFLIVMFTIVGVHLFRTVAGPIGGTLQNLTTEQVIELGERVIEIEPNQDGTFNATLRARITETGEQLALQLATVLGTLVTAVSAFYFGSTAVTSAQAAITSAQRAPAALAAATLSLDSITPPRVRAEPAQIVTLIGTGFVPGTRVKLAKIGGPEISAGNVTIVNGSTITCTFDLSNQAGLWDVVVINPDGNQVRKDGALGVE